MNKKLLFLAGLAPLVAAPALVVASCCLLKVKSPHFGR